MEAPSVLVSPFPCSRCLEQIGRQLGSEFLDGTLSSIGRRGEGCLSSCDGGGTGVACVALSERKTIKAAS